MQKLLLTGASGLLGQALSRRLSPHYALTPLGRSTCPAGGRTVDLCDPDATVALLSELQPDIIVHAAALADVDACEREPARAYRENVLATRHLCDWVRRASPATRVAYVSTDQVYSGDGPHAEGTAAPVNQYAMTKLCGEEVVGMLAGGLSLRTNFFSTGESVGRGLANWLIRSLESGTAITLFDDVYFNPLYVEDYADVLLELLQGDARGVFNLGARDSMSKAEFGLALAKALNLSTDNVRIGSVGDVKLSAARPGDMRMKNDHLSRTLGHDLPDMAAGINRMVADLQQMREGA